MLEVRNEPLDQDTIPSSGNTLSRPGRDSLNDREVTLTRRRLEFSVRIVSCLLLAVWIIALTNWKFPVHNEDGGRDFAVFYVAGKMIRDGLGSQLYDRQVQQQVYDSAQLGPLSRPYNHLPFEALLFLPLTSFGYRYAYPLWTVLSLFLLLLGVYLLDREVELTRAITYYLGIRSDIGLVTLSSAGLSPLMGCLIQGQDSVWLLLIYTLVFVFVRRGDQFAAGCVLALGLFKFQTVLPFAAILLLRRKWRILAGFSAVACVLTLSSIAISGVHALMDYQAQLSDPGYWEWMDWYRPFLMANVRGLVYVLFGLSRGGGAGLVTIGASLLIIGAAAYYWRDDSLELSFAVGVTAAVVTSYHVYPYDLTVLLLPLGLMVASLGRRQIPLPNLLKISLLAFLMPPLHVLLAKSSLYALMAIPALVILVMAIRLRKRLEVSIA